MGRRDQTTSANGGSVLGFEAKLWLAADKLRNNMDAAEYKHVVLGLIFLKYISDTFRRDLHPDLRADYVLANLHHSRTVAALRDTLSPAGAERGVEGGGVGLRAGVRPMSRRLPAPKGHHAPAQGTAKRRPGYGCGTAPRWGLAHR
jgi:hypothetical protein